MHGTYCAFGQTENILKVKYKARIFFSLKADI